MATEREARHFNGLRPDEAERLALLLEELGEAQQIIGKILRHGYQSKNPTLPDSDTNRAMLAKELGDVLFAIDLLAESIDVNWSAIIAAKTRKFLNVWQYLHHNDMSFATTGPQTEVTDAR